MRWFSGFSTLVFAGALLTSPAYAHDRSVGASVWDPYDALLRSYGEALSQEREDRAAVVVGFAEIDALERDSIEGQVASLDQQRGQLVLDTDDGLVSVLTSPDELTNIEVGDVVRVSFLVSD